MTASLSWKVDSQQPSLWKPCVDMASLILMGRRHARTLQIRPSKLLQYTEQIAKTSVWLWGDMEMPSALLAVFEGNPMASFLSMGWRHARTLQIRPSKLLQYTEQIAKTSEWLCGDMEMPSALLAVCEGNPTASFILMGRRHARTLQIRPSKLLQYTEQIAQTSVWLWGDMEMPSALLAVCEGNLMASFLSMGWRHARTLQIRPSKLLQYTEQIAQTSVWLWGDMEMPSALLAVCEGNLMASFILMVGRHHVKTLYIRPRWLLQYTKQIGKTLHIMLRH